MGSQVGLSSTTLPTPHYSPFQTNFSTTSSFTEHARTAFFLPGPILNARDTLEDKTDEAL